MVKSGVSGGVPAAAGGGRWWFVMVFGTSEPLTTLEKGEATPDYGG